MKRAVLIGLTALGAAVALGPGTVGAGVNGETVVTSHPRPGGGYVLDVTAAAGVANSVRVRPSDDIIDTIVTLKDTAGMTDDSPKCTQESPTEVQCKVQGLRRVNVDTGNAPDAVRVNNLANLEALLNFKASLGGGQDSARLSTGHASELPTAVAGPGNDRVEIIGGGTARGGGGQDRLIGGERNQRLFGGRGRDRLTADGGNNDHCDGGGGDDSGGDGCETIVSL
jgi:Ca2+-binding RTX toxin-like protein